VQHELAADGPDLVCRSAEGIAGGNHLRADLAAFAPGTQIGELELPGKRKANILDRDQTQPDGGLAEADSLRRLVLEDGVDVLLADVSVLHQQGTERRMGRRLRPEFDRRHFHSVASMDNRGGPPGPVGPGSPSSCGGWKPGV
jgi:hypothetical protein